MAKKIKLSEKDVKHLAKLADLKLSDEEIKNYGQQLNSILDYIDILNEVDTEKTEATSSTAGLNNVTRADLLMNPNTLVLRNLKVAKKTGKNYFRVNKIF